MIIITKHFSLSIFPSIPMSHDFLSSSEPQNGELQRERHVVVMSVMRACTEGRRASRNGRTGRRVSNATRIRTRRYRRTRHENVCMRGSGSEEVETQVVDTQETNESGAVDEDGTTTPSSSSDASSASSAASSAEEDVSAGTNNTISAKTELKLSLLPPWNSFPRGCALELSIAGALPEVEPTPSLASLLQGGGRAAASRASSLPSIVRALETAARDPRVPGVFLKMGALSCGWAKLEELRRAIGAVRSAGKFTVAYAEIVSMKEFYVMGACEELYLAPCAYISLRGVAVNGSFVRGVLDKIGVEPQIQRIGKYKSAGDQLARRDMSDAQREALGAILDDVYDNFVNAVAADRDKTVDEVRSFLDSGEFVVDHLVQQGMVTGAVYLNDIRRSLAKRTCGRSRFAKVGISKYLKTPQMLFAEARSGNRERGKPAPKPGVIAIVRASGAIGRGSGGSGIQSEDFLRLLRTVRKRKEVKAVVLRIDSPGGDALASDLMWKELRELCQEKPVIASMSDVAASGGYYMSMACKAIVAETLTLTGSIGVVTGKFNLASLYERIGFGKETLSKGRLAEVDADERGFTEEEQDYFSRSAQHAYASFRDKAAKSRSMSIEKMERVAQGRVWTGARALEEGLVDRLGGIATAISMAKEEAGISGPLILFEASTPKSPLAALRAQGALVLSALSSAAELMQAVEEIKTTMTSSSPNSGVQLMMDDIDII